MKKKQAENLIKQFFLEFNQNIDSIDLGSFVKANVGEAILGFEYSESEPALICSALIYRFRQLPRSVVLTAIEEAERTVETGGGEVVFDEESLTLALVKIYHEDVAPKTFYAEMQKLAAASLFWSNEVLNGVADKT